ncbi:MAG: VCBS repeat-containing protein [Planctomycetota bacterium]
MATLKGTLQRALLLALAPWLTGCLYLGAGIASLAFDNGSSGGGGVVILFAEDADLLVARGNDDQGDTTEGRGRQIVAAQFQLTATKATSIQTLTLSATGSLDDSTIPLVRLHRDQNGDGFLDAADPQLGGTEAFVQDDGTVRFENLNLTLAAAESVELLAVLETPPAAAEGQTLQLVIADAQAVEATTQVSGGAPLRVEVFGAPVSGGTRTISTRGTLTVDLGPSSPGNQVVFPNATGVGLLQLDVRTSSAEAIRIDTLRLQTSGSGNDAADVTSASLHLDVDSDGTLSAPDQLIAVAASAATDNGPLSFSGLARTLAASQLERWLVSYDLSGTAQDGASFRLDLGSSADVVAQGESSQQAVVAQGPPVTGGGTVTVARATLTVSAGATSGGGAVTPGTANTTVLQLVLAAGQTEAVRVTSLGVSSSGSGDEVGDLSALRLWIDPNADGVGDFQLASGTFSVDNGTLVFTGFNRQIGAGQSETWVVTADVAPGSVGGDVFTAALAGSISAVGATSGLGVPVTPPAISGGALRVRGSLTVVAGANQPASPNQVFANSTNAPVLQLAVGAGNGEAVRVTSLSVTPAGTGDDATGIATVDLILDGNGDGVFTAGPDTILQSQPFPANDQAVTFANPSGLFADIAPVTTRLLLLRYQLSGQALDGQTFGATVAGSGVQATGLGSSLAFNASGSASSGANPLVARRGAVTLSAGPQNPGATALLNGQTNAVALQLRAVAANGEAVDVTALTVRVSGSVDDTAAWTQVRLLRDDGSTPGVVDGTDTVLGTPQTFAANDGSVTFSGAPLFSLAAGATADFLVVLSASATPLSGTATLSVAAAADLSGTGATSTLSAQVTGAPVAGGTLTLGAGTLSLATGPATPAARDVGAGQANVELLQVRFSAGPAEAVRLTQLRFVASGTVDPAADVTQVRLYRDQGTGGTLDGDPLLGTGTFTAGAVTFALGVGDLDVPAGGTLDALLVVDLSGSATDGETLAASLSAGADATAVGITSAQAVTTSGGPASGNPATARNVVAVSVSAGAIAGGGVAPLSSRVAMLHLQLNETSGTGAARVEALTVTGLGAGQDTPDVTRLELWQDQDASGTVSAGDTLRGVSGYVTEPGSATFGGLNLVIAASGQLDLLVTYDFAGATQVLPPDSYQAQVQVGGLVVKSVSTSIAVTPSGLPQTGPLRNALAPGGAVTITEAVNLADGFAPPSTQHREVLQLRFTGTGTSDVLLSELSVQAAGTGDDSTDLTVVTLWRDAAPVGTRTAADTPLAVAVYFTNDGKARLAGLSETVPSGGTLDLLVTYSLADSSQVSPGETYGLGLAAADVVLAEQGTAAAVTPTLSPTNPLPGATLTASAVAATVLVEAGPLNPTNRDLRSDVPDQAMLHLRLTATTGTTTLTSLSINASGTGNDATDVAAVAVVRDVDVDGRLSAPDVELARATTPFPVNDGVATVAGMSETITGTAVHLLVVYDFATPAAGDNERFRARIASSGDVGLGGGTVTGSFPIQGGQMTVVGGLDLLPAPGSPASAVLSGLPLADQPLLELRARANGTTSATLDALRVSARGSANDTTALTNLRIYRDDGDDVFEPGAGDGAPLATVAGFGVDDGSVVFSSLGQTIPTGTSRSYWIAATIPSGGANPGESVRLLVEQDADATTTGPRPALVRGAAIVGAEFLLNPTTAAFGAGGAVAHGFGAQLVLAAEAADLDRNGTLDLVLAVDGPQDTVQAYAGNGAGGFAAGASTAFPGGTIRALALGDLDRDGDVDVVVAQNGTLSVLLNQGASFARTDFATTSAVFQDVALTDYDGDGDLDLVASDSGNAQLLGRRNDGAGGFATTNTLALPGAPGRLALLDVDRDGLLDAATVAGSDLRLARGDGTFFAASVLVEAGVPAALDLAAGDLDRDCYDDLIVAYTGDVFRVYASQAPGSATLALTGGDRASPGGGAATGLQALALTDANGDGDLDLICVHAGSDGAVLHLGGPAFAFASALATTYALPSVADPSLVVAGRFTADADPDLVLASGITASANVDVLPGDGAHNGGLAAALSPGPALANLRKPRDVALGDLDCDGDLDLALLAPEQNRTVILLWTPSGWSVQPELTHIATPVAVRCADLDRDGTLDLAVSVSGGGSDRLEVFLGAGNGTFVPGAAAVATGNTDPGRLALGDLNRDGILDALCAETATNTLQVYAGSGSGFSAAALANRLATDTKPVDVALVDVTGDGVLDGVALCETTRTVRVHPGSAGSLVLGAGTAFVLPGGLGTPSRLAVGDIDGDGDLDSRDREQRPERGGLPAQQREQDLRGPLGGDAQRRRC